ncbi:MAG TPA: hypothetical protein VJJ21_01055 [Candidatus Nanoarchaeia archaeon]|nr:hypothetical protein [Candidatus Nanoarchaeia archaeon]
MEHVKELSDVIFQDIGLGAGTYLAKSVIEPAFDSTKRFPRTLGEAKSNSASAIAVVGANSLWETLKLGLYNTGHFGWLPQDKWESLAADSVAIFGGSALLYGFFNAAVSGARDIEDTLADKEPWLTGVYGTTALAAYSLFKIAFS